MASFKKNLLVSALAVLLVAVAVSGETYESKRALRQAAPEMAEAEETDDSECGSLEMAEEENTGGGNTYNQGGETNTYNQGGETNTWGTGGTNTWGTTNTGTTDTSQFTQGEYGGEADSQKVTGGTQSQSNINFSSIQNTNNAGTVSPQ